MIPKVGDVMREARNYFQTYAMEDTWTIRNGVLSPSGMLLEGDWIALTGSVRNSGVYRLEAGMRLDGCTDDHFVGTVWLLAPPPAFLALCEDIAAWCQARGGGGVKRESFGSYSVERAVDGRGAPLTWQQAFSAALTPYRRMFPGVKLLDS